MIKRAVTIALILLASTIHAECYMLYGSDHALISAGYAPPFDIGLPNKSTDWIASQSRGEYLIITNQQCENNNKTRNQKHDLKLGLPVVVDTSNQWRPSGDGITGGSLSGGGDYRYKPVHVDAYTRRDGAHVSSHYRALPRRR